MDASSVQNRNELTAADRERLPGLVAGVLAGKPPVNAMLSLLAELDREINPALAVAVFESVVWRANVNHYWVWFQVAKAYTALGPSRDDAAFITGALAVQMQPDWPPSTQPFRSLFLILNRRGRARDAVDLFLHEMELHPQAPAAEPHEIAPLLHLVSVALPVGAAPRPDSRRDHRVVDADSRAPWECPVFGGAMPYALRPLASGMPRPAIDVAELPDAEVLIYHDSTVVRDRDSRLHEDLSVSDFPELVHRRLERLEQASGPVECHEADAAVVILDRYAHQNLCHFLLDQVSRLALYRRAGVDPGSVLVISPEPRTDFQKRILARAGVTRWLGTGRQARVKAGRLWVSTNCRGLEHAGHRGSDWPVAFAREILGGQGERGWRRLYISRADATARQVVNEAEVIALLDPYGFEPIVPGRMPYEAQVAAFRQASHVIAPHGAALAHIVLCPPGAHVLEMFNPLYGTAAYAMQAAACGLNYAAMVTRDGVSDAPEWNDPDLADVSQSQHGPRSLRVDLPVLRAYLATVIGEAVG
jgi:capsular polysaccharide biosynthesis protein